MKTRGAWKVLSVEILPKRFALELRKRSIGVATGAFGSDPRSRDCVDDEDEKTDFALK